MMKKRAISFLLAVCMAVSLAVVPAQAADTSVTNFADISDRDTAAAVESLRLLEVLDGYSDGTFRPGTVLTRAQFCKMAVYAMNGTDQLGRYRTVTVFPDVKPSHWAAAYINMAAKGKNIISGYVDGLFHPDRTVTVGQAVTILLRLLGYKDENIGGIWPDSYMAEASLVGLTDGVTGSASSGLTRGEAAKLFLNLLRSKMQDGSSYITSVMGCTPVEGAMLVSSRAVGANGLDNALQLSTGAVYPLASGRTSNGSLDGTKGTLVVNSHGEALTFVPDNMGTAKTITLSSAKLSEITDVTGVKYAVMSGIDAYYQGQQKAWTEVYSWLNPGTSLTLYLNTAGIVEYVFVGGGTSASAAVVVYADRSTEGFASLAGSSNYKIYKNGASASGDDMRQYDVATYSSATNSIRVCDTKLTVYYRSASPSPQEPETITVLDDLKLNVLPTARETLSRFKPGDLMTLLLTEDNQVAGAVEAVGSVAVGNAVGIARSVSTGSATVDLLCGLSLTGTVSLSADGAASLEGQMVRVSSDRKGGLALSRLAGGASGDLKPTEKMLGSKKLAENVMIFENGPDGMQAVSLSQLASEGTISSKEIGYARTNWRGEVDLIVLGSAVGSSYIYGIAQFKEGDTVTVNPDTGEETVAHGNNQITVLQGNGKSYGPLETGYVVANGQPIGITVTGSGNNKHIAALVKLTELKNVPSTSWSGSGAVTVGGRTYSIDPNVVCYNTATHDWITLEQAHAYSGTTNLYVHNGAVRVIKVG